MQTFLPYPGFAESAAVIDDRRLGKQRVETFQVLRALVWPTYGWKNHPAVAMWRGCIPALVSYGVAVCDEWVARGRADATRAQLLEFSGGHVDSWETLRDTGRLPPWIGHEPVHLSHRSSLLRKEPEHYRGVFGDIADDLPYVWPGSIFPRWPVRRGHLGALDVEEAARICGLDGATDEQRSAVAALSGGGHVALEAEPGSAARQTALIATLSMPGPAVWLLPGAGPAPGPAVAERGTVDPGGATSGSIARAPGPAELDAMAAEAASPAEVLFLHEAQVRRAVPEGTGLLVADDAAAPRSWHGPTLRLTSPGAAASRSPRRATS